MATGNAVQAAGHAAGTAKIGKAQVLSMRRLRARTKAAGNAADWRVLGVRFGVHAKTAYRICTGMVRRDVGGPLEPRVSRCLDGAAVANRPRCGVCGAKLLTTHCLRCQGLWHRAVLQVLREAGLVSTERRKRRSA